MTMTPTKTRIAGPTATSVMSSTVSRGELVPGRIEDLPVKRQALHGDDVRSTYQVTNLSLR